LNQLGNPQKEFKSIHIAGTNGKGSVSKIIYNLLRAHGCNVGLLHRLILQDLQKELLLMILKYPKMIF